MDRPLLRISRRALASAPLPILDFLAPAVLPGRTIIVRNASSATSASPARASASTSAQDKSEGKAHKGSGNAIGSSGWTEQQGRKFRASDVNVHKVKQARPPPPTRHRTPSTSSSAQPSPSIPSQPRPHPVARKVKQPARTTLAKEKIDPIHLLNSIRSTGSKSPSATSDYNAAHHKLLLGVKGSTRDFNLAFKQGWIPIRNLKEVGRLPTDILVKVLEACIAEGPRADWTEVKELILWLAGENTMPGLSRWAWLELENGEEGARRVVEIWESILRGEHLRLRNGEGALDGSWKKNLVKMEEPTLSLDQRLYATYITARSILHSSDSPSTPFATVLPTLFPAQTSAPKLAKISNISQILRTALSKPGYSHLPEAPAKALAWLRQVELAQLWHEDEVPGRRFLVRVKLLFKQGDFERVKRLWGALKEALGSETVQWISTEEWNASAAMRWVDGRDGLRIEARGGTENEAPEAAVDVTSDHDGTDSIPQPPPSSTKAPGIPSKTFLHQAHLAPLISGFTQSRNFDVAGEIWSWISSHDPPLSHGIVSWTALLQGYTPHGNVLSATDVWDQMWSAGVKPDVWAWMELVIVHFYAKDPDSAIKVVNRMLADQEVRRSWEGGKLPEVVYRRIILGLLRNNRLGQAQAWMKTMQDEGVEITTSTINLFLRHYTTSSRPDFPGIISSLQFLIQLGLEPDVFTFTMILQSLLASKQADATAKLMKIMDAAGVTPTVTTYGAIINSLVRTGETTNLRAAVELLNEMEARKFPSNEIIYTSILQGFLRAASADATPRNKNEIHPHFLSAMHLKARMAKRDIKLNRIGFNAIIHAALAMRSPEGMELALSTFREMQKQRLEKSVEQNGKDGKPVTPADTWLVLFDGLGRMDEWGVARELLGEMHKSGFVPQSRELRRLVDNVVRGGYYSSSSR